MSTILTEFAALCRIPRKSKQEEKIAAYLQKRGEELGLKAVVDSHRNVIYTVPATLGYENAPLTILQAHTDMVCVGGPLYNPLTDPIIPMREGNTLRAEGTSLGADDGIGVALILDYLQGCHRHGPLRVLFTADEEEGMSGAAGLDSRYLEATYLINLDWEDINSLCLGCAGFATVVYEKKIKRQEVLSGSHFEVAISGLAGGHSGVDIATRKENAIALLGVFLASLAKEEISFSLLSFQGGAAANVIPTHARAELVVKKEDVARYKDLAAAFAATHMVISPGEFKTREMRAKKLFSGLSPEDSRDIAMFLCDCPNGVKEMSATAPGRVSTSSNLAVIEIVEEDCTLTASFRSDEDEKLTAFHRRVGKLAAGYGFAGHRLGQSPAWPGKGEGKLLELAVAAWRYHSGKEPALEKVHAGLECSYFAQKNPKLEMISIGPTIHWCHSVNEVLYLDTLAPLQNCLKEILEKIQ